MLINLVGGLLSQCMCVYTYICIYNHHIVHSNYLTILFVKYTIKLKKVNQVTNWGNQLISFSLYLIPQITWIYLEIQKYLHFCHYISSVKTYLHIFTPK